MTPNLNITNTRLTLLSQNNHLDWNHTIKAELINSIQLSPQILPEAKWNKVVSPGKYANIKFIGAKRDWNECNSLQNLNELQFKNVKKQFSVQSKNVVNLTVMSNKKKRNENLNICEIQFSFNKNKKAWNESNQESRNGELFVAKERKENTTNTITVRAASLSFEKEGKKKCNCHFVLCKQDSFMKNATLTDISNCKAQNCSCDCHRIKK